jgi:hypothetical protein
LLASGTQSNKFIVVDSVLSSTEEGEFGTKVTKSTTGQKNTTTMVKIRKSVQISSNGFILCLKCAADEGEYDSNQPSPEVVDEDISADWEDEEEIGSESEDVKNSDSGESSPCVNQANKESYIEPPDVNEEEDDKEVVDITKMVVGATSLRMT